MANDERVLITGTAGKIGMLLRSALAGKYVLSGVDRVEAKDTTVADLTDLHAILSAFDGQNTRRAPGGRAEAYARHRLGPAHAGQRRRHRQRPRGRTSWGSEQDRLLQLMHVDGLYERDHPYLAIAEGRYDGLDPDRVDLITHEMPVRPDGPYAVSKIFGEALGRYYAEEYGMSVMCIRLGTVGRDDRPGDDPRSYVSWFSHRDVAAMVERCIEAQDIAYDIFFGASANTWKI